MRWTYPFLADTLLALHLLFVVFMVLGFLLTVVGGYSGWAWIRNSWFRMGHLIGIGVVVVQAWLGHICPLTTLEMWLRQQAGRSAYSTSLIQYWFERILYFEAPLWVFAIVYTLFGTGVIWVWIRFPPNLLLNRTKIPDPNKPGLENQPMEKPNEPA